MPEQETPDRIEKEILIRAPRSRVWRAIADQTEFGTWFRVAFPPGVFKPGARVSGNITYPGYEHVVMDIEVVEVTPERTLSFRWDPYDPDLNADHTNDPKTLVTFTVEDTEDGTLLRVVESGFAQIPAHRRAAAFRMNEGGWAEQVGNVERHVTASL